METDAANRRRRDARAQPIDRDIVIGPRDRQMFLAIERHGYASTPYLDLFAGRDFPIRYNTHQKRCTKLYNGFCPHMPRHEDGACPDPVTYLAKHPDQFETINTDDQPLVYHLTSASRAALRSHGTANAYELRRSNSFVHDLGLACFSLSFDLTARRFRFREDLLADPRCPEETRNERAPFYFPTPLGDVYFDDLLGNEYEEGRSRFFVVEFDRSTKRVSSEAPDSVRNTLKAYQYVLATAGYKRFGLPNTSILYATTTEEMAARILRSVGEIVEPRYQSHFLVKVFPDFDKPFRVPAKVLDTMTGWRGVKHVEDISRKAP